MHLRTRAAAALALLAAAAAAAAALAAADYATEQTTVINWDDWASEVIINVGTTEPPGGWTTEEAESSPTIRPQYSPQCPPVHLNSSVPCGDSLQCENDRSCPEGKICCPHECGRADCRYFEIRGTHPTLSKELQQKIKRSEAFETESETMTPEDLTPPPYILPFLVYGPGSFCPKLDPEASSNCMDMCSPWISGCPRGQICCLNNCGAGECMEAIYKEDPEQGEDLYDEVPEPEEDGSLVDSRPPMSEWSPLCPKLDLRDAEPCLATCSPSGDACPEGQVCCRNKCGYGECKDAVVEGQLPQKEKEQFFWELYAKNTIHQYEKNVIT